MAPVTPEVVLAGVTQGGLLQTARNCSVRITAQGMASALKVSARVRMDMMESIAALFLASTRALATVLASTARVLATSYGLEKTALHTQATSKIVPVTVQDAGHA